MRPLRAGVQHDLSVQAMIHPKDAHAYARANALPCPCCGQPLILASQECEAPSIQVRALFALWTTCLKAGEIMLVPAEHCAEKLVDGSGGLV